MTYIPMPLCDYYFYPQKDSLAVREKLEDQIHNFAATLLKNGNISGDYVLGWVDNSIRFTCYVPDKSALAEKNISGYSKKEFKEILKLSRKRPTKKIYFNRGDSKKTLSWKDANFLYLFTYYYDDLSPVMTDKGDVIPLYKIPLMEREREEIYLWSVKYRNVHRVWLDSGSLEKSALIELTNPSSELSGEGQTLCRKLEQATGKKVYYYIWFYKRNKLCPVCGSVWQKRPKLACKGEISFEFICEKCRLVGDFVRGD